MKSALRKNAVMEIFKTKSRFLSIFCIVAIGIAFFAGVKNTSPDMKNSADSYYKSSNLAHFRIVSTLGFSDNDIAALREIDGIQVYPARYTDVLIDLGDSDETAHVMSLDYYGKNNDVNMLRLAEGRFPEKADECLMDAGGFFADSNMIGEKISMHSEDDLSDILSVTEYTVVGTFTSSAYVDKSSRGSTTIGNGSISSIICVPAESFVSEVYTEIYITADALALENAYTDGYDIQNDIITGLLEQAGDSRKPERYDEVIAEANREIADAEQELEDGRAEAEQELADAKAELDDAAKEIEEGEKELADAKAQLEDAEKEIEEGRAELDEGWELFYEGEEEFETKISEAKAQITEQRGLLLEGETQYRDGLAKYRDGLALYNEGLAEYNANREQYEQGLLYYRLLAAYYDIITTSENVDLETLMELFPQLADYIPSEREVRDGLTELEALGPVLEEAAATLEESRKELDAAERQLSDTRDMLDEGWLLLIEGENTLEREQEEAEKLLEENRLQLEEAEELYQEGLEEYLQGKADYEEGLAKFQEGKAEYEDGLAEYSKAYDEVQQELAEAEEKIADAKRELAELELPEWYIFDRTANPGYSEYGENAERVNNIAAVFPVFFILVAALVCLTTMTRMVEEQRSQIGTLKALGYSNGQIVFKFMFYALTATLLGSVIGAVVGQLLFPFVILKAYGMLYTMPETVLSIDWLLSGLCTLAAAAAVMLTVYLSCRGELMEQPAQLMRPKAPRAGKKILLDRLPFWKRVGFNFKVTARNLFRYKRRMLMTVIGIAGCTALTLTGFALQNSISDIVNKQFAELFLYDGMIAFDGETEQIFEILEQHGGSGTKYFQKSFTVNSGDRNVTAYVVVPEDMEKFREYYVFRDRQSHEPYELDENSVLIDEKSSLLLGIKAGDEIKLYQEETDIKTVTAAACTENYPNHYIYMTKELYRSLFGEEPAYNMIAFDAELDTEDMRDKLAEELLTADSVLAVSYKESLAVTMINMLEALNSVIIVLILSAGALAFVVLYNLTNININERIREIATLKVMGFYDIEVDGYIFRENILLTLMGIGVGLIGGIFLAEFVITTAEVDLVMFGRDIYPMSFLLSGVITLVFSIIVALYMHRHLKKVDMIEALKSVE